MFAILRILSQAALYIVLVLFTVHTKFFCYVLLIIVLQLSWFFPICPPPLNTPYSLRQSPTIVHVHGSCVQVLWLFHFLYCTISPWLFCDYLLVLLKPLTSSPIPPHLPLTWQPSKYSPYPWFCLCSCLLSFVFRFNCW